LAPPLTESILFEERFRGFYEHPLGGYVGGRMAKVLGPDAEVRFSRPVPLGVPLQLDRTEADVTLSDGGGALAEARQLTVTVDAPIPPTVSEAEAASRGYQGHTFHFFPECFCCGPARAVGDGLRVFPGPVPGRDMVAACWTPDPGLGADGNVECEYVWSAIDCPGIWALVHAAPANSEDHIVTGTLAVHMLGPVEVGERHIIVAWRLGEDGRRIYAGTAIFSLDGTIRVLAKQTCIRLDRGVPLGLDAWRSPKVTR